MASIDDSISTEELGFVAAYEVEIILDEVIVLIIESIFEQILLVVEVRNDESIEISLTLNRVKYECSLIGYFDEVRKFYYQQ